ncbi:MAG: hypothetical protein R3B09_24570 [Nannocystaceae bacterium]
MRSPFPWLIILLLGCLVGVDVRAAEPDPCAVVWGITELREGERRALHGLCRDGSIPEPRTAIAAIFRVLSPPAPNAGALAQILERRRDASPLVLVAPGAAPPDLAAAQGRLDALAARLASTDRAAVKACGPLRQSVAAHVQAIEVGEPDGTPFLHDDPALLECIGGEADLTGVHVVALRADNVASLLTVAATPELAAATWLPAERAIAFGRTRYFLVAVPPSAAVATIARLRNAPVPAIWSGMAPYDLVAWEEPPPMTCVTLDATLRGDGALFVDGALIPAEDAQISQTLAVTRDDHHLVVVECPEGRACYPRYRDRIDRQSLQRRVNQCLEARIDVGGRARETVAILGATDIEACRRAPLGADLVRRAATDYLSQGRPRERHDFHDLSALASMSDALATLRGRLNQQASGDAPATGEDSVDLINGAARAAWRQGIDVLLSFQLQCTREDERWHYNLETTRIYLSSMFSRGQLGDGDVDLESLVESESESWGRADQFTAALEMTIDRSLGIDYLRLLHDQVIAPYRGGAELLIAHSPGRGCREEGAAECVDADPEVVARRLPGASEPLICRRLHASTARGAAVKAEAAAVAEGSGDRARRLKIERDVGRRGTYARVDRARLAGSIPGWYLVVARRSEGDAVGDAICVELRAPTSEIWGDIALSSGDLYYAPRDNPEVLYLRARLGFARYLLPWLGVGAFLGYGFTNYELGDGRPSWQDLDNLSQAPLHWSRHALLAGGVVDLRLRHRAIPFDVRLRAAPTIALGVLALDMVDFDLPSFVGSAGGGVRRIDVDFDLHVDVGVSYEVGPVTIANFVLLGLTAIDDGLGSVSTEVHDNAGAFIGFGVGVGGAR